MIEEFRQAIDKRGLPYDDYFVSNLGRVASRHNRGRGPRLDINGGLKLLVSRHGPNSRYKVITLRVQKKKIGVSVHSLVATAWHGLPPTPEHTVNHKDGNKRNNHADNLEWMTLLENERHSYINGLKPRGSRTYNHKLTEQDASGIRLMHENGWSQRRLARLFSVSNRCISFVTSRQRWKHVA